MGFSLFGRNVYVTSNCNSIKLSLSGLKVGYCPHKRKGFTLAAIIPTIMFWKREKAAALHPIEETIKQRPCRFCILYISERFKHIMFVPQGKIDIGIYAEIDDVISDVWPCEFGKLQENIEVTLNRHKDFTDYVKGNWPSYKNSKAKSQKSFETDYIAIHLRTDLSKDYGERELERIIVTAWPDPISNTYYITGTNHLYDTKIAQIVCDIFEACLKIRN